MKHLSIPSKLVLTLAVSLSPNAAFAEDSGANDPEVAKKIKEYNDKAALENAAADAKKAIKANIDAASALSSSKYPVISGGKDGTTSVDGTSMYPKAALEEAYRATELAARDICALVKDQNGKILLTPTRYNLESLLLSHKLLEGELTLAKENLNKFKNGSCEKKSSPTTPPKAAEKPGKGSIGTLPSTKPGTEIGIIDAAPIVNSLISITKILRTDREIHMEAASIKDEDLIASVRSCLSTEKNREISTINSKSLVDLLETEDEGIQKKIESIRREWQDLQTNNAQTFCKTEIATNAERFENFWNQISTKTDSGDEPALQSLRRADIIRKWLKNEQGKVLQVGIISSGGATQKTSHTFFSDRLYASGNVVATYSLMNSRGLIDSRVLTQRTHFRRIPLD